MFSNNNTPTCTRSFILVVLCACLFLLPSFATLPAQPPGMPKATPVVRVEAVGTLDASQPKNYVGVVTGKRTVNVVSRVSGYLDKVAFTEGAHVEKGDVLFEIEDTTYKNNVRVAEAVVKQIEAEIELAKRDHERAVRLSHENGKMQPSFEKRDARRERQHGFNAGPERQIRRLEPARRSP